MSSRSFALLLLISVAGKRLFRRWKNIMFSLIHAIWNSYGHLGGRPLYITVCCRGVQSLVYPDQFCPTISIKVSTAKLRRSEKCGRIRGARITTGWDTPRYLPCESRASLDLGYRSSNTHLTIISGEVRRSENPWRASTSPKFNCTVSQTELVCVQRGTTQIP